VSDRSATIALWFLPLQGYADIIVIKDVRFTRFAGLICRKDYIKLMQQILAAREDLGRYLI
jgi:hypothetical protein